MLSHWPYLLLPGPIRVSPPPRLSQAPCVPSDHSALWPSALGSHSGQVQLKISPCSPPLCVIHPVSPSLVTRASFLSSSLSLKLLLASPEFSISCFAAWKHPCPRSEFPAASRTVSPDSTPEAASSYHCSNSLVTSLLPRMRPHNLSPCFFDIV